jgi:hypothetical protein
MGKHAVGELTCRFRWTAGLRVGPSYPFEFMLNMQTMRLDLGLSATILALKQSL